MIIGIDGAFVKGRPPTDRANLEIITGRIEADAEPSKVFAVVRDQDGRAKQRVQAFFRQQVPALRDAVYEMSQDRPEAGFDKLKAFGGIQEITDKELRLAGLGKDSQAWKVHAKVWVSRLGVAGSL